MLDHVYHLDATGMERHAASEVAGLIDKLCEASNWSTIDTLLSTAEVGRMSLDSLMAFVGSTWWWREHLTARDSLVERARKQVEEMNLPDSKLLLPWFT